MLLPLLPSSFLPSSLCPLVRRAATTKQLGWVRVVGRRRHHPVSQAHSFHDERCVWGKGQRAGREEEEEARSEGKGRKSTLGVGASSPVPSPPPPSPHSNFYFPFRQPLPLPPLPLGAFSDYSPHPPPFTSPSSSDLFIIRSTYPNFDDKNVIRMEVRIKSEPDEETSQAGGHEKKAVKAEPVVASPEPQPRRQCRCRIDMSSPDALERDFYAWLNVSRVP